MVYNVYVGSKHVKKIREKKEKNTWSVQIMNELIRRALAYEYDQNGRNPHLVAHSDGKEETLPYKIDDCGRVLFDNLEDSGPKTPIPNSSEAKQGNGDRQHSKGTEGNPVYIINNSKITIQELSMSNIHISHTQNSTRFISRLYFRDLLGKMVPANDMVKGETAILLAAKNGITEMVEKILEIFPIAIHDMNSELKNVVLLAVESRQTRVYRLLLRRNILKDNIFRQVDSKGNSALHLAAMLGGYKPWLIPGAALQMQWEIKWFQVTSASVLPRSILLCSLLAMSGCFTWLLSKSICALPKKERASYHIEGAIHLTPFAPFFEPP